MLFFFVDGRVNAILHQFQRARNTRWATAADGDVVVAKVGAWGEFDRLVVLDKTLKRANEYRLFFEVENAVADALPLVVTDSGTDRGKVRVFHDDAVSAIDVASFEAFDERRNVNLSGATKFSAAWF